LAFIIAAANLHAYNYGLRGETDPVIFRKVADSVIVPEFSPRSGVKVQITENDPVNHPTAGAANGHFVTFTANAESRSG
jgi:ubiquitin-activating enzyme E1